MGYGAWKNSDFIDYNRRLNRTVGKDGKLAGSYTNQEMFVAKKLDPMLDPRGVVRECCDCEEHPQTLPVILALDVTGSMGQAAVEVARQLNVIMTDLYEKTGDVQFMIMGIGDFAYDLCPLQVSQFEADIRIAEQLDKLYFEFGGGGNMFESYTAAWYFALHHTRLDAWKRGRKGVLITMGDERLNPYIPLSGYHTDFSRVTGDHLQADVETKVLFNDIREKYELYHVNVDHRNGYDQAEIEKSWRAYLDANHFRSVKLDGIAEVITAIVKKEAAVCAPASGKTAAMQTAGTSGEAGEKTGFLRRFMEGIAW